MAVPGLTPKSPPTELGPVLLTVVPAKTTKLPAVPRLHAVAGGAAVAHDTNCHGFGTGPGANGAPAKSVAPVVMVAVNVVLVANALVGVKVAVRVATS